MNRFVIGAVILLAGAVQSCSKIPDEAYFTRGQPESLLSVNTEAITIDLAQRNALATLTSYVSSEDASRAVVTCSNGLVCTRAQAVLDQYNVPYDVVSGATNSVAIEYDRIEARDCDNRFISNHNNPYNLNHPTFGCSMAMNQVMMVRDKRQYTDPLVLGPYDGFKAAQNYDTYLSRQVDDRVIQVQQESVSGNGGN